MKAYYLIGGLLLLFTSQASAEQYLIHLDTSESPDPGRYEALSAYGDIYTVRATQGCTTTLLGPYANRVMASYTLDKIRFEGHYGAFISQHRM